MSNPLTPPKIAEPMFVAAQAIEARLSVLEAASEMTTKSLAQTMETINTSLGSQVMLAESSVASHFTQALLLDLVIWRDETLRLAIAEAILRILQSPLPDTPLSPEAQQLLRSKRDALLQPASPEIVAAMSRPHLRPVK